MPMDSLMDDSFKRWCIGWQSKFCWWPKTCFYSKKRIWLTRAYCGTAMITGPGEPVFITRWINRNEYLLARIKGII